MENLENQNFEQDSYQTGSTKPPKNRGGLVAGLLIVAILLAGVSSILGVMNIQLTRMLREEKESALSFAPNETKMVIPGTGAAATGKPKMGLSVGSISELDQRFYHLPAGVLITEVDHQGCAAAAGLAVGDIILTFNGTSVVTPQALEQVLLACQAGDRVEVEFYRYRTQEMRKVTVILEAKG